MPVPRDRHGYRRDFDPHLLEAPDVTLTYALWNGDLAIKFGKTRNHPRTRQQDLQVGSAATLHLVGYSVSIAERRAHRLMHSEHLRGEFFKLTMKTFQFVSRNFDWVDVPLLNRMWRRLRPRPRRVLWSKGIRAVWHHSG
jgi:hypothetical protein